MLTILWPSAVTRIKAKYSLWGVDRIVPVSETFFKKIFRELLCWFLGDGLGSLVARISTAVDYIAGTDISGRIFRDLFVLLRLFSVVTVVAAPAAQLLLLLVAIAYYTLAERKVMAAIQRRRGPNVVGYAGLLQPLADGLKLVAKELMFPAHAAQGLFFAAPLFILALSLTAWGILPSRCELAFFMPAPAAGAVNLDYGVL